tara:strand:- start:531 stop:1340 length:810 start_codon:yes stop_codon:yes gene_type:complete
MATKAQARQVEVAPQEIKIPKVKKDTWEIKERLYEIASGKEPLVYSIATAHSRVKSMLWFDKEAGYQRELRYATNQRSPFVDEQKGQVIMGRIIFRNGKLSVPKENVVLQKLLSLYHPDLNNIYKEYKPQQIATNEVEWIEYELAALNMAKGLSLDEAEGILRVEIGEQVNNLSSAELKRDVLIFARKNPQLFLELATDDNTQLRNFGVKSVEQGILNLSQDQRTFTYGTNGRKVMTVPFDEHPYSALSAFFKTDEGMEIYKAIEKRLK